MNIHLRKFSGIILNSLLYFTELSYVAQVRLGLLAKVQYVIVTCISE